MKKSGRIILIWIVSCINAAWASQTLSSPDETRVGICDLTFGTKIDDPDYLNIINADNGFTGNALQWADVEPEQGVYDFSKLDLSLRNIRDLGRFALIKLNGNDKPDWLFDIVPYHPDTSWDTSVFDTEGILAFWHPNFINAYTNLLNAYSAYLQTNSYQSIISGIRQNFNPIGTEHTSVPTEYRSLDQWIVPAGVDSNTVQEYTTALADDYKELIVDVHVEQIMPHTFVYMRSNIEDAIFIKHQALFESGQLGFFHTGASMEQNQVFNQDWRYSRYIELCRTGQTRGFSEMAGWYQYLDTYPSNAFPKVQWNYWRLLSDLHTGVSMSGFHYFTLFRDLFDVPEFDDAWRFADKYLGLHADPANSPGAWVALRGAGDNYAGDYTFLMEREGDNPTSPLVDHYPGVDDKSYEVSRIGSTNVKYGAWARALPQGASMKFHVDPGVFAVGEPRIARVVYLDSGTGNWELRQGGVVKMAVTNSNSGVWLEPEVLIETDGNAYELANTGTQDIPFHMLEVKRTGTPYVPNTTLYTATDDTFIPEAYPTQNKGGLANLRTRGSLDKTILVRFEVDQMPSEDSYALLRLRSLNMDENATVRLTDATWSENSVTWDTRPVFMENVITQTIGTVGSWYEWDVSSVITTTGTYSFAIESFHNTDKDFVSKEGGTAPELVMTCSSVPNRYQLWLDAYSLSGTDAEFSADPDEDGMSNLEEYAFNGNPTNSSDKGFVGYFPNANNDLFTISYASNTVDSSLRYSVLDCTNLTIGVVNTNQWDSQTFGPLVDAYQAVSNHYNSAGRQELFIKIGIEYN